MAGLAVGDRWQSVLEKKSSIINSATKQLSADSCEFKAGSTYFKQY